MVCFATYSNKQTGWAVVYCCMFRIAPLLKKLKSLSLRLILLLLFLMMILWAFYQMTDEFVLEKETRFDRAVHELISGYTHPSLTRVMIFFTFFGSRAFLLPAYFALGGYYLFFKKRTKYTLGITSVALLGAGVLSAAKRVFRRERPLESLIDKAGSFSYPSGHSFSAFTFVGILIYLIWLSAISNTAKWIISVLLVVFAAMVAFSRVYLNVHFASDILAGFCLSVIWLAVCYFILIKSSLLRRKADR